MKSYTVHCEYPALHRCEVTVEAADPVAACRAAIDAANHSDAWKGLDWEQPTYVSALVQGTDVDPWRRTPEGADASVLPLPGLFSDVTRLAGYAATRSEDLVLQLRIMLDAVDGDGGSRIDKHAMVRLCATGRAILDDIERCGLPPKGRAQRRGWSGSRQRITRSRLSLSARGMGHMGRREPSATCDNRAVLPLRGCPLHPGLRGFPRPCLGAVVSRSASQEVPIRRKGRRHS